MTESITVTKPSIVYSELYDEYRCTDSAGCTYYTDDKYDAVDTLCMMTGDESLEVSIKRATMEQTDNW